MIGSKGLCHSLFLQRQSHAFEMTEFGHQHRKVDDNCCRRIRVDMFTNISLVASYAGIYSTNLTETVENYGMCTSNRTSRFENSYC